MPDIYHMMYCMSPVRGHVRWRTVHWIVRLFDIMPEVRPPYMNYLYPCITQQSIIKYLLHATYCIICTIAMCKENVCKLCEGLRASQVRSHIFLESVLWFTVTHLLVNLNLKCDKFVFIMYCRCKTQVASPFADYIILSEHTVSHAFCI